MSPQPSARPETPASVPKLVCPAGGRLETVKAAVDSGADEIYVGVKVRDVVNLRAPELGLRGQAWCFTFEQVEKALEICRPHGVRLEVALNNRYTDSQLDDALASVDQLYELGVRDFIVADPGMLAAVAKAHPEASLHVSIMGGTANHHTADMYRGFGVKRVILENNLTADQIARIRRESGVEVEVFIYGIPCFAFHGSCYLSSFRGSMWPPACARKVTVDTPEGKDTNYYVKPRDLDLLPRLPDLFEAGVDAVKIEGRIRSTHYVRTATSAVRHILDSLGRGQDPTLPSKLQRQLSKLPFFGTSAGFMDGTRPEPDVFCLDGGSPRNRLTDMLRNPATLKYVAGKAFGGSRKRAAFPPPVPGFKDAVPRTDRPAVIVETSLCDPMIPAGADRVCVGERQCPTRFLMHAGKLPAAVEEIRATGAEAWVTLAGPMSESQAGPVLDAVLAVKDRLSGAVCHDAGLAAELARHIPVTVSALVQSGRAMSSLTEATGAAAVRLPYLPLALLMQQGAPPVDVEIPVFGVTQLMSGVYCPTRVWKDCKVCGPELWKVDQEGLPLLLFGNAVYSAKSFSAHLLRERLLGMPFSGLVIDTIGQDIETVESVVAFYKGDAPWKLADDGLCNGMLLEAKGAWHAALVPWIDYYPDIEQKLFSD